MMIIIMIDSNLNKLYLGVHFLCGQLNWLTDNWFDADCREAGKLMKYPTIKSRFIWKILRLIRIETIYFHGFAIFKNVTEKWNWKCRSSNS